MKLNPGIKDEVIQKMSKDNLLQELMKIACKRNMTITKDSFVKAGKAMLIRRAIAFKKLSDPLPTKLFFIFHNTPDDAITSLSAQECKPLYIDTMKERNIPLDENTLSTFTDIHYHARLLNYRDYLKTKHDELATMMLSKLESDSKFL